MIVYKIWVGDTSFEVFIEVFAKYSGYFSAIFSGSFYESNNKEIVLDNDYVTPQVFEIIRQQLYKLAQVPDYEWVSPLEVQSLETVLEYYPIVKYLVIGNDLQFFSSQFRAPDGTNRLVLV